MRILLIMVGLMVFTDHMMAMKRSPRKALQQVDNQKLSARFDKIRGLEWYKVKGWSATCISPAESSKDERLSPLRTKAAVKTASHLHATLLKERLQVL